MTIRPIDHNVLIPKAQEVSATRHIQNTRNENFVENEFIRQEKLVKHNRKKVLDTEKSENTKIKTDSNSNNQDKDKKKKYNKRKIKVKYEDDNNKKENKPKGIIIGENIDIRI